MSGGLNGTALPAYTNFLFVFYVYRDIGKENKKVDWAQHRATSRVVHNTVSQYSYFYYHWIDFKRWKQFPICLHCVVGQNVKNVNCLLKN